MWAAAVWAAAGPALGRVVRATTARLTPMAANRLPVILDLTPDLPLHRRFLLRDLVARTVTTSRPGPARVTARPDRRANV